MKKNKALFILTVLLISISISSISFATVIDIKDHWAKDDINQLIKDGKIEGYPDGRFRPNRNITRAEFIKIVNNVFEYGKIEEILFHDVKKDDWFYEDIRKAVGAGYIGGCDDNTMRPNRPITRQEASKIVAIACGLDYELSDSAREFKDIDEIESWSLNYIGVLKDKGYMAGYDDGSFKPKNQITRAETAKLLSNIRKDIIEDEKPVVDKPIENKPIEQEPIKPIKPKPITKDEEFTKIIEDLPNSKDIKNIIVEDKIQIEKAKKLYDTLTEVEESKISKNTMDKFLEVDRKIKSLKTPIKSKSKATIEQAQVWAIKKGAHKRFVDIAPIYWQYGELTGTNPEIIYAQAAKETNFGKYTGAVKPEMNNWAGIKTSNPVGDTTYDHETFATPVDGVRGHFNHMGIYCGVEPIGKPHPRWYVTKTVNWAGTIQCAEDLGGKWAPNPDYGISIIRDYVNPIYNTAKPSKGDLSKALEFSNKVERLIDEDRDNVEEIMEMFIEYNSLSYIEQSLIPFNIKEEFNLLLQKLELGYLSL